MEKESNDQAVKGAQAPLIDRINTEPIILNGMSHSEIMLFGALFLVLNMLFFSLIAVLTEWYLILLFMPLLGTVLSIWFFS